jgi:hypothetical protein
VGRTTPAIYTPCQIFRKCTRRVPSLIITQEVDLRHQDDFFMCPDVRMNPSDKCYQSLRLLCTHTYMPIREVTRGIESPPISLSFVYVLVVDLRLQRIQSHSSNSIITATDSKHVATALSLSVSPSLFLSLFLLLIDLRPQRIESHSLKTPLSCTTDSKSHRAHK